MLAMAVCSISGSRPGAWRGGCSAKTVIWTPRVIGPTSGGLGTEGGWWRRTRYVPETPAPWWALLTSLSEPQFPTLPKGRVCGLRPTCPGLVSCGCLAQTRHPRAWGLPQSCLWCDQPGASKAPCTTSSPDLGPHASLQSCLRGQSQVQGWEAWLPRPCLVTFTHLPLTGRRRPPTGVWAEGASSSPLTEGKAPASAEHCAASGCGSSRPPDSRVTDPGGRISSHVHVFPLISGGDDAGVTKAGTVGRMRGLMHTQAEDPHGRGPGAGEVLQAQSLEAWRLTAAWA